MNKRIFPLFVLTGSICLAVAGCSNHNIDTAKIRAAFPSLNGDAKVQMDAALAAIDSGNYSAAVKPLDKARYEIKMDKKQAALIDDTVRKVRDKAREQK